MRAVLLGVLAAVLVVGTAGESGQKKEQRQNCVDPAEIDVIKDGMKLIYGNDDDEAAQWFRSNCWNSTVGIHVDSCTCFYWAFRAHSVGFCILSARLTLLVAAWCGRRLLELGLMTALVWCARARVCMLTCVILAGCE